MFYRCCVILLTGLVGMSILWGCDVEKFAGYNYEAEALGKTVKIKGRLTDKDSNLPVQEALISIDGQEAISFTEGKFALDYLLGTDEAFGKFIPVTITTEKYFPFDTSMMIFPGENELNVELVFGAPEPLRTLEVERAEVFTATVRDPQGIDDIEGVYWIGYYWVPDPNSELGVYSQADTTKMELIEVLNANTARYQATAPKYPDWTLITRHWNILAVDKIGLKCMIIEFYYHDADG